MAFAPSPGVAKRCWCLNDARLTAEFVSDQIQEFGASLTPDFGAAGLSTP
jgi:hypothetical protein